MGRAGGVGMVERRWVFLVGALALLVLASLELLGHRQLDLDVYRAGAQRLLDGLSLYDQPRGQLPFTYPPFAALAMLPLAVTPALLCALVVPVLSVGALVLAWRRIDGADRFALVTLSLGLEPVWSTLHFGQINLILMALVLLDLSRPTARWCGVAAGVAAGVKLTPLIFAGYLLVTGQWAALRRFLLAFVATMCLPLLVAPDDVIRFWTRVLPDSERIGAPWFAINQSAMGVLARLGPEASWVKPAWLVVGSLLAALCLWLARRLWQRQDPVGGVATAALAGLLASPVSWSHHWVWAIPMAVVLARWTRLWVGAVWSLGFVAAPFLWLPRGRDQEFAWTWEHAVGNTYVLLGLLWLLTMSMATRRRSPASTLAPWLPSALPSLRGRSARTPVR